jgi:hypothetical protein
LLRFSNNIEFNNDGSVAFLANGFGGIEFLDCINLKSINSMGALYKNDYNNNT